MTISLMQAILVGVVYYLGFVGTPWFLLLGGISIVQKPLVAGLLVGIILGDPVQGAIMGAAVQLPFVAYIFAGGSQPNDPGLAGTLGVALGMAAGLEPTAVVAISVPIALLGTIVNVLRMSLDVAFVHIIDKAAEEGNMRKAVFWHIVPPQILCFFLCVVPVALGCYFGADAVTQIISMLDGRPLAALEVVGGLLPALGIAMNLRTLDRPGTLLWFVLGFVVTVYFGLSALPVAVLGGIAAFLYTGLEERAAAPAMALSGASAGASNVNVASDDSDDDFE